jgi:hypothetical protein
MKVIFSRKGFDAEAGGVASPILPDKRLCSIPIPSRKGKYIFRDIRFDDDNLGRIVEDLTRNKKKRYAGSDRTHYDPDLRRDSLPWMRGWLPAFGPSGPAQSHLADNRVGVGDLFLFFGWFREVEEKNGHYQYVRDGPNIHLLFGWLQIGRVYHVFPQDSKLPSWANRHAEVSDGQDWRDAGQCCRNWALHVAKKQLDLPGVGNDLPGGGAFKRYDERLRLTEPGKNRGCWRLPGWMYPFPGKNPLTFHRAKRKWKKDGKWALLQVADRGQEFVLDCSEYPQQKVKEWLADLFGAAA